MPLCLTGAMKSKLEVLSMVTCFILESVLLSSTVNDKVLDSSEVHILLLLNERSICVD